MRGEGTLTVRAGDSVWVKSPLEILATLDENGTLNGLPFMPEMLEDCGRRLRVLRKAEKTCIEMPGGDYAIREFLGNDVFLLENLRCSGAAHDGCQRVCMLFWKAAWLATGEAATGATDREALDRLAVRLKTRSDSRRYFCQSTQLSNATRVEPLTRMEIARKCVRDVRSGAVRATEMALLVFVPLFRKIRDRVFGRPRLIGELARTPTGTLGLQPGDLVQIKTIEEMRKTLDTRGRNRGLVCDIELKKFSGTRDVVRSRLDRMISEATGEMRTVEGTVILERNTCMCARVVGGCPRLDYCYWREIWLAPVAAAADTRTTESLDVRRA